ncbi:hypothetical protein HAX54_005277, partial [Datura stramonium]|nr:hypothetical protein [Datura stramonium]
MDQPAYISHENHNQHLNSDLEGTYMLAWAATIVQPTSTGDDKLAHRSWSIWAHTKRRSWDSNLGSSGCYSLVAITPYLIYYRHTTFPE